MLTHISNNYLGSTVHSNLAQGLSEKGVSTQFVYCPLQKEAQVNDGVKEIDNVIVVAPKIFTKLIRYFPLVKVLWSFFVFIWVLQKNRVKPSFVIAHNFWSDGMVAWLYSFFSGTPFIVAVRSTDINHFIPKLPHYRWLMRLVHRSALAVVPISPVLKKQYILKMSLSSSEASRVNVITNAVDDYWHENITTFQNARAECVVFVGSTLRRKNVEGLYKALKQLKSKRPRLTFKVVGWNEKEFCLRISGPALPNWVEIIPKTTNKEIIKSTLRSARVFATTSWNETFGLVYLEALSQGCAIVCSKNDGIDGLFDEPFVKSVDSQSEAETSQAIDELLDIYEDGVPHVDVNNILSKYTWRQVAQRYIDLINLKEQ